jgi:MFS family permease
MDDAPWPSGRQAWGIVALLTAAYFLAYIDRTILSLLVEPIKHSLRLSDTQIGLLQGVAFSLFFTLATFPAGWVADRGNRTRLIAWGIAIWSVMTALGGFCTSFAQLFVARMGVAAGEATLTPSGPSLIADSFPPERRSLPIGVYSMAGGTGAGLALIAGGAVAGLVKNGDALRFSGIHWLQALEAWQVVFLAVGLPGVIVSLCFFLTKEPQRRHQSGAEGSLVELFAALKTRRAVVLPQFAAMCLYNTYAFAYLSWMPAFFIRVHHWTMVDVGLKYGLVQLTFPIAGALAGGAAARWLWRRGRSDASLLTSAACLGLMCVPAIAGTLVHSTLASALLLGSMVACAQAAAGNSVAAIQELMPNRLRGRTTAIYYIAIALTSVTFGPILIGVMNDHAFSVGTSLSVTAACTIPIAALLLFYAAAKRQQVRWVA